MHHADHHAERTDLRRAARAIRDEATIRYAPYMFQAGAGVLSERTVGPFTDKYEIRHANAWRNCGAGGVLAPWKIRRAGVIA